MFATGQARRARRSGTYASGCAGEAADLPPVSKVVLTLELSSGRLEIMTVLVFFRLEPWRSARWGAA